MNKEIWKDIVGYEGFYQVSNMGNVRSVDRWIERQNQPDYFLKGKTLKPRTGKNGYRYVCLYKGSNQKTANIHRLVATAFVSNSLCFPVVNHIDGNKENNTASNLEWCSSSDNAKHAVEHGMIKPSRNAKALRSQAKMKSSNTSGTKGVYFNKRIKKWQAYIKVNYKMLYLGVFENKEDAIKERLAKEREFL